MNIKSMGLGFVLGVVLAGALFYTLFNGSDGSRVEAPAAVVDVASASQTTVPDPAAANAAAGEPESIGQSEPKTRFKVRTIAEAGRSRRAGEYILDSEIEQLMTKLDEAADRGSVQVANEEWARYAKVLTTLGMPEADQLVMKNHYQKIVKAKLAAGQMATSLANAQSAYEQGMRRLLGENFDLYSAYEAEGVGRFEVRMFAGSLARSDSGAVMEYDADQLFGLFSKYQVYSSEALGFTGLPFQPNPTPRSGVFASQGLKESLNTYIERAKALFRDPDFQGLAPDLREAIAKYIETNGDRLSIDYRASIDPEFASAMRRRNPTNTKGKAISGKLGNGMSFSTSKGVTKIEGNGDGG